MKEIQSAFRTNRLLAEHAQDVSSEKGVVSPGIHSSESVPSVSAMQKSEFNFIYYTDMNSGDINGQSYEKFGNALNGFASRRSSRLTDMITQLLNLDRAMALSKINSNMLKRIDELKAAAEQTRLAASDLVTGAAVNLTLTGASQLMSMQQSNASKNAAGEASEMNKEADPLKARKAEIKETLKAGCACDADEQALMTEKSEVKSQLSDIESRVQIKSDMSGALSSMAGGISGLGGTAGKFAESVKAADSKLHEADKQEIEADAQVSQAAYEAEQKALDSLKQLAAALIASGKEVKDAEDQVRALLARNV